MRPLAWMSDSHSGVFGTVIADYIVTVFPNPYFSLSASRIGAV
jgi:hypothetical protein